MQTRVQSAKEIFDRTGLNFVVAAITGYLIWYPIFNISVNTSQTLMISVAFTIQGAMISYMVRRFKSNKGQ